MARLKLSSGLEVGDAPALCAACTRRCFAALEPLPIPEAYTLAVRQDLPSFIDGRGDLLDLVDITLQHSAQADKARIRNRTQLMPDRETDEEPFVFSDARNTGRSLW